MLVRAAILKPQTGPVVIQESDSGLFQSRLDSQQRTRMRLNRVVKRFHAADGLASDRHKLRWPSRLLKNSL